MAGKTQRSARLAAQRVPDNNPTSRPSTCPNILITLEKWLIALAILLGLVIYAPSLTYEFTIDDIPIVVENPRIIMLDQVEQYLATSWWDRPGHHAEYRPLTMATFALNYALAGLNPIAYHLVNILLHAIVTGLVGLLVLRLFANRLWAGLTALIFAIHPVHIEAVVGIVGRAELLMSLGFIGALIGADASRRRGHNTWLWILMTFFASLVAVFSKEHAVLLPGVLAVIIALDHYRLLAHHSPGALGLRHSIRFKQVFQPWVPSLLAVILAVLCYFIARKFVLGAFLVPAGTQTEPLDNPLVTLGLFESRIAALAVLPRYALRLVFPLGQSPDYSYQAIVPPSSLLDPAVMAGLLLIVVVLIALAWYRRNGGVVFALCFLGLTFLLASNLLLTIGTIMAERLLYLPSIGFCLLAGIAIAGTDRLTLAESWHSRPLVWVAFAVWSGLLLGQHFYYLPKWHSNESLSMYVVERVPRSARAQLSRGITAYENQNYELALKHINRAIDIYPQISQGHYWRGVILLGLQRPSEALVELRRAHAMIPWEFQVSEALADLLTQQGQLDQAEMVLKATIAVRPENAAAWLTWVDWLIEQGRLDQARQTLESMLDKNPAPFIQQRIQARIKRIDAVE